MTWSLSGADGDRFDIDNGTLTFKSDPNFEAPADANRDNVYEVTAQASDGVNTGTLDITVTVGNVEEAGTVTLSNRQPEDNVPITAMLSDPDVAVQSSVEWQWEDSQGEISGATSATFRPIGGEQVGEYPDGQGDLYRRTRSKQDGRRGIRPIRSRQRTPTTRPPSSRMTTTSQSPP